MAEPNRYDDPYWTKVAADAESKQGLPSGVLQAIVMHGERSNNDQVSSAGAKTPFQIIPSTRDAFLKKYGVDAYLSPENAATVAALHIKDSIDRGASVPRAIGEYNGGTDPSRWDKTVSSYIKRVLDGMASTRKTPQSTFQAVQQEQPKAVDQLAQIYDAYKSGQMGAEDAEAFEADVKAGKVMLPKGASLQGDKPKGNELPAGILQAYKDGRMLREDKIDLERDVSNGLWTLPQGEKLGKTDSRGIVGSIKEALTGAERRTAATEAAGDWAGMPELNQLSAKGALAGLATMATGPKETVDIIQSQFPGVKVRQDEKGNFLLKSSIDGKDYAFKPGFQASDIPRVLGGIAAFVPAGRATTVLGSAAAGAGTEAAIQGTQAAAGGEFNAGDVLTAGGVGAAVPAVARVVQAVRSPAQSAIESAAPVVAAVDNPATIRAAPVAPVARVSAPAPAPAPRAIAPEAITAEDLGKTIQTASGEGMGAVKAQERIAAAAKINPEAMKAAEKLGIELPADVFSDSQLVREAAGLTRSVAGSTASASWRDAVQNAAKRADEVMGSLDASPNVAGVSSDVLQSLNKTRSELESAAVKVSDAVRAQVPATSKVQFPNLRKTLADVRKETPSSMTPQEKRLESLVSPKGGEGLPARYQDQFATATYGDLLREKDSIGKAMSGKESPYGNMTAGALKRLYGALAEDQLANVERIGGKSLRDDLRQANQLYTKKFALEKRIVNAFGNNPEDGSIANVMRQAIESGSKGNVAPLNKLLKIVPEDMQKEVVGTALMSAARAKGGAVRGDFGFSEFNKLYTGLRNNEPVYARVVTALGGKDAHDLLSALNTVSKRVTDARANVLTTGKANQALVGAMKAEGLVSSALNKIGPNAAAMGAYLAGGHWTGAVLARATVNALKSGKPDVMEAAGKMFSSPEFQKIMIASATGKASPETVKKLAISSRFADFARRVNLPREMKARERWIMNALQSGNTQDTK